MDGRTRKIQIKNIWLFKSIIPAIFTLLVITGIIVFLKILPDSTDAWEVFHGDVIAGIGVATIIYALLYLGRLILWRANFYFSFEDKYLLVKDGILSKKERHIFYWTIQNITVRRDVLDMLFKISNLVVENASQGAGTSISDLSTINLFNVKNRVVIPGLDFGASETLKTAILEKMKENKINNQFGL